MEYNKPLSEKESLALITQMINKAKDSYHDTGIGAIMWGAIIAFCSLEKFAEVHFNYELPFNIYLLTLFAIIPQVFITIKEKKERKVKSYDDSYLDAIWLGFGICIVLMTIVVNNVFANLAPMVNDYKSLTTGSTGRVDFKFYEYVSSLLLLLYGLPTFITGLACKFKPMLWGGIFCWVCCIVAIYTSIKIDLVLTAASAIMAWLVPGILMEIEYREYKKEQTIKDV
jgi:hypothetical protein